MAGVYRSREREREKNAHEAMRKYWLWTQLDARKTVSAYV